MEYSSEQEKVIDAGDDEGWVDTHHFADKSAIQEKVSEMKLEDEVVVAQAEQEDESDDEAVDMEAFIESGMLEDAATVDPVVKTAPSKSSAAGGEIVSTRTYDLNITYDKYCQGSFFPNHYHPNIFSPAPILRLFFWYQLFSFSFKH